MNNPKILWLFTLSLVAASSTGGMATTVTLQPVADTTLQEAASANNYGGGASFTAGTRRQGGATRALLRFDLAGSVPQGAIVTSAELTVTVTATPFGGPGSTFELLRVSAPWEEGTGSDRGGSATVTNGATWMDRLGPGTPWTTPGGDFAPSSSSSQAIAGSASYMFASTPALVSDVQSWVNVPGGNFGWLLRSQSESNLTTIRRFASRGNTASAPTLVVRFETPPRFTHSRVVAGSFASTVEIIESRTNLVERRESLGSGGWQVVATIPPGTNSTFAFTDPLGASNAFYRVRVP